MILSRAGADRLGLEEKRRLLEGLLTGQESGVDAFPLSFSQQGVWLLEQVGGCGAAYHVPWLVRLRGRLDARALADALAEVVRRHDALRTRFAAMGGEPVQVVGAAAPVPLPVLDLASLPAGERARAADAAAAGEARRPFDLERGPLLRSRLVRLADEEHLLLLTLHHLVFDGTSARVLFGEVAALYGAFARGESSPLPEPLLRYVDYVLWQREALGPAVLDRQAAYWKQRLERAPGELELPADRPRPAVRSPRGSRHRFRLEEPLVARLRELAGAEGCTLYMVLLGAFQALLRRYTGREDLLVGSPVAGRSRREFEGLIGFFAGTLVLRTDLSGDPTFRRLLARVRATTLGAHSHPDLPFEQLVEVVGADRSLARNPLFQVAFVMLGAPLDEGTAAAGLAMEPEVGDAGAAKWDLTLFAQDGGRGVAAWIEYSTDLFDAARIVAMARHYALLLERIAADPDTRLSGLALLSAGEVRRLVHEWNPPPPPLPARCVHELFAEQAGRTPDAVALVHGSGEMSYAELHRRSDRLAGFLAARGAAPGTRVGVCLERSAEMVVALLAILKAGGAYVPMDPGYPPARLAFMLADADVPLLLTDEGLLDRFPEFAGAVVCVDRGLEAAAAGSAEAPPARVTPEHLAYVIYTSGSAGEPKGTEVPHRAIPGFFRGVDYVRFDRGTVVLQHSSTSWDALTLELWPALLTGGRCVLYPGDRSEPETLREQVRAHGVNTLWLTAAYFNLVVDTCPEALEGVSQVMTGGEAVSPEHVRRALARHPGLRLVNGYGPSECTVFATCHPLPRDFAAPVVPIGTPVGDRRVYLLDLDLDPVPAGVPGEVFVGGPAVARGYLNRPELTAERFVPDPFSPEAGARLYRSGDRARRRADGLLEFAGRLDFQVKVRGFRVEPGEVEAALAAHPGVREAAVVPHRTAAGEVRLAGYVTAGGGIPLSGGEVRRRLREQLPEHMVPASVTVLREMPLTPHGKLDRHALPAPEAPEADGAGGEPPRTPTEAFLAGLWAREMGVERVGVHDDFFALGGHSLMAARLMSRVHETYGTPLPLRTLFEHPTVAGLAEAVVGAERTPGEADEVSALADLVAGLSPQELEAALANDPAGEVTP
jgi:amino acid adenylation domain-containing protein